MAVSVRLFLPGADAALVDQLRTRTQAAGVLEVAASDQLTHPNGGPPTVPVDDVLVTGERRIDLAADAAASASASAAAAAADDDRDGDGRRAPTLAFSPEGAEALARTVEVLTAALPPGWGLQVGDVGDLAEREVQVTMPELIEHIRWSELDRTTRYVLRNWRATPPDVSA